MSGDSALYFGAGAVGNVMEILRSKGIWEKSVGCAVDLGEGSGTYKFDLCVVK